MCTGCMYALSNYYMGFILCVFSVLYFIAVYFEAGISKGRWWKCWMKFSGASLLGGGTAAFFINRRICWKQKAAMAVLLVFDFAGFHFQTLNLILHGLHKPVGMPNRFAFVFVFLLLKTVSEGRGRIEELTRKELAAGTALCLAFCAAVQTKTMDLENLADQLSSYNRMENHLLQYQKEVTDLKEFVEKYLEENEALIREYRLEILCFIRKVVYIYRCYKNREIRLKIE